MQIQEASRPQVGGSWCGTSWGPSIYYSETKSITLIIRLLHLSKDQNNYNFDFRMAYKVLRRDYATVRYGGTPPLGKKYYYSNNEAESGFRRLLNKNAGFFNQYLD